MYGGACGKSVATQEVVGMGKGRVAVEGPKRIVCAKQPSPPRWSRVKGRSVMSAALSEEMMAWLVAVVEFRPMSLARAAV